MGTRPGSCLVACLPRPSRVKPHRLLATKRVLYLYALLMQFSPAISAMPLLFLLVINGFVPFLWRPVIYYLTLPLDFDTCFPFPSFSAHTHSLITADRRSLHQRTYSLTHSPTQTTIPLPAVLHNVGQKLTPALFNSWSRSMPKQA